MKKLVKKLIFLPKKPCVYSYLLVFSYKIHKMRVSKPTGIKNIYKTGEFSYRVLIVKNKKIIFGWTYYSLEEAIAGLNQFYKLN